MVQHFVVVPAEQGKEDLNPADVFVTTEFVFNHVGYSSTCCLSR